MLACYPQRRQHLPVPPVDLPSPSPSHTDFFNVLPHTTCTPSPSELNLRNYFTPSNNLYAGNTTSDSTLDSSGAALNNSLMNTFDFSNPAIRVQQSTPVPQLHSSQEQTEYDWTLFTGNNTSLHTPAVSRSARSHQRAPSASSIGSDFSSASGNASNTNATPFGSDESSSRFAKQSSLPTPSQTPTHDTFLTPTYQKFNPNSQGTVESGNMAAHFALKQVLQDKNNHFDEEIPGFAPSSRHSVSSYGHNSPATPHDNDYDDTLRIPNDITSSGKFDNMPDMFNNNQQMFGSSIPRGQSQMNNRLPHRLQDRLNAANATRSHSPANSISRAASPFRQNSPYAGPQNSFGSPHQRFGTASSLREQQQPDTSSAMKNYKQEEPKTISPKDALLDYDNSEDSKMQPLFSENEANSFNPQYSGNQFAAQSYDNASNQSFPSLANGSRESWNASRPINDGFATPESTANFNFVPRALPNGLPQFSQPLYRPTSNMQSPPEPTPDFPAHLTSMESSASDAGGPDNNFEDVRRPETTSASRGTYSCTYHGCPLRFETPQKLQKHKREGHRQNVPTTPITPGVGSGMSSAELLQRNSQAGPHKCNRINPTTGKPCNTEFSRPYDLTRHEDTIHNNRKQKVRCALCVEDKTFSRNDALTRHMRVVHPDVDFPGKHRRRGGPHD